MSIIQLDHSAGEGQLFEFAQYWHAIHFVISQQFYSGNDPLDFIMSSENSQRKCWSDFGSANFCDSKSTSELNTVLETIGAQKFKENWLSDQLEAFSIYPSLVWTDEAVFQQALDTYLQMKAFIAECNDRKLGFLSFFAPSPLLLPNHYLPNRHPY